MKRHPLIAGNWKMNGTLAAATALARAVVDGGCPPDVELAVCPPFVHLPAVAEIVRGHAVTLGAQDVSAYADGAYTGEVSATMLAELGCTYAIVGHSERRQYHHESNGDVAAKASAAIGQRMVAIICVGETRAEREAGQTANVIEKQIGESVPSCADGAKIVIAYEPVWAIGTGLVATPAQVAEVHAQIRGLLEKRLARAEVLRIIYGGSVKPDNAAEILSLANVDGALVGGASLKADSFRAIANAVKAE